METNDGNNQPADDSQVDGGEADPVRNLKAEFGRKFENTTAQIAEQNRKLDAMLAAVQERMQPASQQASQQKPLRELLFEDGDAAERYIEERAAKIADQVVERKVQVSQASQQAVGEVIGNFPEFGEANSAAATLAIQKVGKLPKHLQGTPEGTKMAMMEAAAELGLVPAKARKAAANNDDFVVGGSAKGGSRKPADPLKDIPEATLQMAQLLGRDISDPKVLEGLRAASKRGDWSKYR